MAPGRNDDVIRELTRDGNEAVARARTDALTGAEWRRARRAAAATPLEQGVFFPIVDEASLANPLRHVVARVEVTDRGPGTSLDPATTGRALDEAWVAIGAVGQRPPAYVHVPYLEARGEAIAGDSYALAVSLAAAGHWSGQHAVGRVLATGTSASVLQHGDTKRQVADATGPWARRFAASSRPAAIPAGFADLSAADGVRRAISETFLLPAWHDTTRRTCIHVGSGPMINPPTRFAGRAAVVLPYPFPMSPAHVEDAVARIAQHARPGQRTELSIGASTVIAAILGERTSNWGDIVVIQDEEPWWANTASTHVRGAAAAGVAVGAPPSSARVRVRLDGPMTPADPFEDFPRVDPGRIQPSAMLGLLRAFWARYQQHSTLHLAFKGNRCVNPTWTSAARRPRLGLCESPTSRASARR